MWSSSHWGRVKSCYLWEFRQKWACRNLWSFRKANAKFWAQDRIIAHSWTGWGQKEICRKELEVHSGQEVDRELALCLAVKWAGHTSGYDSKGVVSRLGKLIHPISSALVRLHLECCVLPRTTLSHRRKSIEGPPRRLASESIGKESLSVLGLFNV